MLIKKYRSQNMPEIDFISEVNLFESGRTRSKSKLFAAFIVFLTSMVVSSLSFGIGGSVYSGPVPNIDFKVGRVMARSIVIDPATNQPILVEFNEQGEEVGVIETSGIPVNELSVIPVSEYFLYRTQLRDFRIEHRKNLAKGAELLTRLQYEDSEFLLADNLTTATKRALDERFASVLVRGQSNRIIDDPSQLILLQFGLDLTQSTQISPNDRSLLVNKNGQVISSSPHTIGYRTGFFGDPNAPQSTAGGRVDNEDSVFGPVQGVKVFVDEFAYTGGVGITDNQGKYSFQFGMPLCPIGGFTYTTDVWAELRYKNFLPTGSPSIPYYLRTPGYSYCYASLFAGGSAPSTFASVQSNLYADVMFVTGKIVLKNFDDQEVPVGITTYKTFLEDAKSVTQNFYDFNGDGENDKTIQGRLLLCQNMESIDKIEIFQPDDGQADEPLPGYSCSELEPELIGSDGKGNLQGIFFDGEQNGPTDHPDLIRLIDKEFRNEPIGVLKEISENDMRNTDLLFFRESTGQLILQRRGLKQEEAAYRPAVEYDPNENQVAFRVMLRGRDDSKLNVGGGVRRSQSFEEWATEYQLATPFRIRQSDQPRPGEFIKIVAINRATGYTGTARVQLMGAGSNSTGSLDVQVPTITLTPPNLKIWAKRNYEVEHGMTRGEEREYTIGSEGAALASDSKITLYTEWLDEFGKPLPDELGLDGGESYGFTGRFAKVVGANSLDAAGVGSDLAEFPIAPGKQTQVLKVKGGVSVADHFYIHVIGKPKDQECVSFSSCPSFTSQNLQSNLKGRPALLTPFLIPLADEDKHWKEYNEYLRIRAELEELDEPEETFPNKPLPAYAWQYRPEYQFSQFDLQINELNRSYLDENGAERVVNILELENPTISSSDYVTALYSLISSEFDVLKPLDGQRDLVLALGEQELRVQLGEDRGIRFDDIRGLENLDIEDFLTLRLYANNDSGNILWEYAFDAFAIYVTDDQEFSINIPDLYYVTADNPEVNLAAELLGYYKRKEEDQTLQRVRWEVESGEGLLTPEREGKENSALFNAVLTMPTQSGASAVVKAVLETGSDVEARFKEVIVLPGQPVNIEIGSPQVLYAQGANEIIVEAHVTDQFGNNVIDGTTLGYAVSGDIYSTKKGYVTIDGRAQITLKGGYLANEDNTLTVYAGDVSAATNLSVRPILVAWAQALPIEVEVMSETELTAIVKTPSGAPVKDAFFEAYTSRGALFTNQIKTDENGEFTFTWHSGSAIGESQLRLRIGNNSLPIDTVSVINSNADSQFEFNSVYQDQKTSSAMLVNGITESTEFIYTDIEDIDRQLTFLSQMSVEMSEQPDARHTLTLKGLTYPNREPLIAVESRDDLNGKEEFKLIATDVVQTSDSPYRKTSSYSLLNQDSSNNHPGLHFRGSSRIRPDDFVVSGAFKLTGAGSGQLININEGLVVERYGSSLKVIANLGFEADQTPVQQTLVVSTPELGWFNFAVSVENQNLTVKLNDSEQTVSLSNNINFVGGGVRFLESAANVLISNLGLYDWSEEPLTLFGNGKETREVQLSSEGEFTIAIRSTGHLSDNNEQFIVQLSADDAMLPIVLMQRNEYELMAGIFVDALGVEPSHAQVAALYEDQNLYGDPLLAASRLLGKVADDGTLFRESSGLLTVLALLGRIEGLEHLQDKVRTLQKFIVQNESPILAYAAIDNISVPVQKALMGDYSDVDKLSLQLTVLSEMLEYAPDIAEYMVNGIVSAQDMTAWFDHFTKPLDGWVGLTYRIPKIDALDCDAIEKPLFTDTAIPMSFDTCRQTGQNVADWVRELAFDGTNTYTPQEFAAFLRYLNETMPYAESIYKKNAYKVFNPTIASNSFGVIPDAHAGVTAVLRPLKWALKFAGKRAKISAQFWLGNSNHRVSPLITLFIMDYLQTRIDREECNNTAGCKLIDDTDIVKAIESKIDRVNESIAVFGTLQGAKLNRSQQLQCSRVASTHGSLFELQLIAYYQLLHEINASGPIAGVEASFKISYGSDEEIEDKDRIRSLLRRADLLVQKSGSTVTADIEDKILIEGKSLQVKQKLNKPGGRPNGRNWAARRFPRWNLKDTPGTTYHRQFVLDNIAINAREINDQTQQFAGDYQWWFHSWSNYKKPRTYRVRNRAGVVTTKTNYPGVPPDAKEIGSERDRDWHRAADRLSQVMKKVANKDNGDVLKDSIGFENVDGTTDFYTRAADYYGTRNQPYFINPRLRPPMGPRFQKVKPFSLITQLSQNSELSDQFTAPPEFLAYYEGFKLDAENINQFIDDLTKGLEDFDIPLDIPVDEWLAELEQSFANSDISFFGDNCDF